MSIITNLGPSQSFGSGKTPQLFNRVTAEVVLGSSFPICVWAQPGTEPQNAIDRFVQADLVEEMKMDPQQFSEFRHQAVHELMRLNELCKDEFQISAWPRWDYDLERGTLTFSANGVPKVSASIQVIGTTSVSGGTWMWGWANESLLCLSKISKCLSG